MSRQLKVIKQESKKADNEVLLASPTQLQETASNTDYETVSVQKPISIMSLCPEENYSC